MSYLNLCCKVYSHIQSSEVQKYYINKIKDNISYYQLMFLIRNGFYPIEEKIKDVKYLFACIDKYTISDSLMQEFEELSLIEKDFYNNSDDIIFSGNLYKGLISYNDELEISDNPFYGRNFNEFINSVISFKKNNKYHTSEDFMYGYVDKIHVNASVKNFVRYKFYYMNDKYVLTDGDVYENNDAKYSAYFPSFNTYKYPFLNGDKLVYKLPIMITPFYGTFVSETDYNGVYYAFLESDNERINLTDMFSIFKGYQSIDWLNKINEGKK